MISRPSSRLASLTRLIQRYWSTPAITVSSNTATHADTSQFILTRLIRANIARIIAFKSDHRHRLEPGLYLVFTKRWSLYEQFTQRRPPFAYDRCSSTNHSRGEPMRKLTLLIILVATAAVALPQQMPMPKTSCPQSDAQKAFETLKTLAGSWEGSIMGMPVQITNRLSSGGNVTV